MFTRVRYRAAAGLAALSLLAPVLGCGHQQTAANSGASQSPYDSSPPVQQRQGLSTKQKLALVAGAAALYYMYKNHVNAQNQPANVQYYRSKNGGVYYRDANHVAHWVTPPPNGFQLPADEAARYQREAQNQGFTASVPSGPPSS